MSDEPRRIGAAKTVVFSLVVTGFVLLIVDWVASYIVPPPPRISAVPRSHYFEFDPILMWRPMPGYRDDKVAISNDGFRGEELIDKRSGRKLVLLLGGSTVFGLGLNGDQTISHFLQQILDARSGRERYQVVNAGVTGYYSTQELVLAQRKLIAYEPAMIIALTGRNDIFYSLQPAYRLDSVPYHGQIRGAVGALDPYYTEREARPPALHIMKLMSQAYRHVKEIDWAEEWSGPDLKYHPESIPNFIRNEKSLHALLAEHGVEYHLFLQPLLTWPERESSAAEQALHRPTYLDMLTGGYAQLAADAGRDIEGDWFHGVLKLQADTTGSLFIDNAHFSELGCRQVARSIAAAVFGQDSVSWINMADRSAAGFLAGGWHDMEAGYRWTGRRAQSILKCPEAGGGALRFRIEGDAGPVPTTLRILFGEKVLLESALAAGQVIDLKATVPAGCAGTVKQLTIEASPPWVPKELGMNSDPRELGVLVRAFGFEHARDSSSR